MMVIAVVPVMADGGLADSAWPKAGHDLQNTGQSTYIGPQTNMVKWTFPTGGIFRYITPVIGSDGTIYVGSHNTNLYALNPNGTQKWIYNAGSAGAFYGSAAVGSEGSIYISANKGVLISLNPDASQNYKKLTVGASFPSSGPSIGTDGTIYIGNYKGLYVQNPADGSAKWSNTTVSYANLATPAIASDGTIYIGSYKTNTFYAFNPDGTPKWEYLTGGLVQGSPAIGADGTIYVGSSDNKIYAFNPDGTVKWTTTTGNAIYGAPAIGAEGTIYIGSRDSIFYALNPADGTPKWTYTTGGEIRGAPAIGADGTIYFVGWGENKIYALNSDGSLKWTYTMGGTIGQESWGSPSIASDGTLYVTSYDGILYAFKDSVSQPVAEFSALPLTGPAPLSVQFTDASTSSEALTYAWDFDNDGVVDNNEKSPSHSYDTPGKYTVNLTVTNSAGSNSMVKADYITVEEGTTPAPEFPTMALPAALIVGMLGAVLFIRRTKEN
jgi:outer membrane protein assembly factor BamB